VPSAGSIENITRLAAAKSNYRYQEGLVAELLHALRRFREKLGG
jgi:hypothetical protein